MPQPNNTLIPLAYDASHSGPSWSDLDANERRQLTADYVRQRRTGRFVTHFSPTASAEGPKSKRVAVCGVPTETGDDWRAGSSNLVNVTCRACRRIAAERNLPPRAASVVRAELNRLAAELKHLVADYEDGDRQDPELARAIRAQKREIIAREAQLAACAVAVAS